MTTITRPPRPRVGDIEAIRPPPEVLEHLDAMSIEFEYEITKGGERVFVPVIVQFSNHCYTRTRLDSDPDDSVLFRERRKDGGVEERVWCPERAAFSKRLPDILRGIGGLLCLRGDSKEILYRVAGPGPRDGEDWYVCMRLSIKVATRELIISVRSVHPRANRPADVRGSSTRGWAIFAQRYSTWRAEHRWLIPLERKNPLHGEGVLE